MTSTYKWPIIGHLKQLAQLEADIAQNRISHAYLFEGPGEIGKTTVARTFAQVLQCAENFCKHCHTCRQIEKSQHIDTLEFLDHGESFKIEEVRELLTHLATTRQHRYKIILIQNIERMTPEATNALLKTLEEPNPGRIFLFTATQKQILLDTLLSRVRIVSFNALPEITIRTHLKSLNPDLEEENLKTMSAFAMGKPGRALAFVENADHLRFYKEMYEQMVKIFERSTPAERMIFVEEIVKKPQTIEAFLELFLYMVRHMIFQKLEGNKILYSEQSLFAMIDGLNRARFELDHNVNQRLVLENLLLQI